MTCPDQQNEMRRPRFKNRKALAKKKLNRIAVLPTLITLMNAVCGFASIHFASQGGVERLPMLNGTIHISHFALAAWMIVLGMVADSLDGFVARKSGLTSDFGGQLDSMSDIITFGVAPAFLMLKVVESELAGVIGQTNPLFGTLSGKLFWLMAALYVCCAALRLARFNVENSPNDSAHRHFRGLPSPAAAGQIVSMVLLYSDIVPEIQAEMGFTAARIGSNIIIYLLPWVTVGMGLLMVSRIPYSHFVNQMLKGRKPFEYIVLIVIVTLLLFWKLQLTLATMSIIYVFSGLLPWLRSGCRVPIVPVESPHERIQELDSLGSVTTIEQVNKTWPSGVRAALFFRPICP